MKTIRLLFAGSLILFWALSLPVSASDPKDRTPVLPETKLRALAETATALARCRLADNPKDNVGLSLLKFARYFYPNHRDLLLLRGQLKYGVKIEKPKNPPKESEFVSNLEKSIDLVDMSGGLKSRKMLAIIYSMTRLLDSSNEEALVNLVVLEDTGVETDLDSLLAVTESEFQSQQVLEYDKKDPRYVVSNVKKTIIVPADAPWTDTWIKVREGKMVRVKADRTWGFGKGPFPLVGPEGFENVELTKTVKTGSSGPIYKVFTAYKDPSFTKITKKLSKNENLGNPGSLLAKIGDKIYPVCREATFRADNAGILFFGPFEWDDYSDNNGELMVTIEVSDK